MFKSILTSFRSFPIDVGQLTCVHIFAPSQCLFVCGCEEVWHALCLIYIELHYSYWLQMSDSSEQIEQHHTSSLSVFHSLSFMRANHQIPHLSRVLWIDEMSIFVLRYVLRVLLGFNFMICVLLAFHKSLELMKFICNLRLNSRYCATQLDIR